MCTCRLTESEHELLQQLAQSNGDLISLAGLLLLRHFWHKPRIPVVHHPSSLPSRREPYLLDLDSHPFATTTTDVAKMRKNNAESRARGERFHSLHGKGEREEQTRSLSVHANEPRSGDTVFCDEKDKRRAPKTVYSVSERI